MTAVNIICFAIYFIVALLMISIGVSQLKSQEPVGFYSGEKPPKKDELTDVISWNKKHGTMWVLYGIIIMISYFIGAMIGDSAWSVVPMCGGLLIPVVFMILYHNKLKKKYLR